MRIPAVDIGVGTQDILLFDSSKLLELPEGPVLEDF